MEIQQGPISKAQTYQRSVDLNDRTYALLYLPSQPEVTGPFE